MKKQKQKQNNEQVSMPRATVQHEQCLTSEKFIRAVIRIDTDKNFDKDRKDLVYVSIDNKKKNKNDRLLYTVYFRTKMNGNVPDYFIEVYDSKSQTKSGDRIAYTNVYELLDEVKTTKDAYNLLKRYL